jgi:hypothetical protein
MYQEDVNPRLMEYAADYKVNLVSPARMSDMELDTFKSDLKEVLKFIKHSTDKDELKKLLDENENYKKLLCSDFCQSPILWNFHPRTS